MKFAVYTIIDHQVSQLMQAVDALITEKQFVKANMNSYCSNRIVKLVNQLNGQLVTKANVTKQLTVGPQPINLGQDTMMSVNNLEAVQHLVTVEKAQTVFSDHKSTSRSINKQRKIQTKGSMISIHESEPKPKKKQQNVNVFTKINMTEVQKQDNEILQKRKVKQQEAAQKRQLQNQKIKNNKNLRKLKQAYNFDYNGQIIEVKLDKKNNLVSKVVMPNVPKQKNQKDFSQLANKPKATFLKTFQVSKDEQNKNKKVRKSRDAFQIKNDDKIDVQFSKIKNPIEVIDVKQGVKAIFNQSTLEHKKKKVTDEELLKSRSTRKFSRNEYARIKTTTLRTKPYQENSQDIIVEPVVNLKNSRFRQQSALSQNIKKRAKAQVQSFKVRVQDPNLKKELVERIKENENKTEQPNCEEIDKLTNQIRKQGLSRIDRYNLHYSRNKGAQTLSQRKNSGEAALPHIHLKSETNYIKAREKVKDGAYIRRELLKKFEDNLRV